MLTQEQNLIFQSYFTFAFLTELKNNNLLQSEFFEKMEFGSPWIKEEIKHIGIDNQGCALMALYAMLVIPRQLISKEFEKEYAKIDLYLKDNTSKTLSNYESDKKSVKYLRHIRNAVAHSRVSFLPNQIVTFTDEGWNKNKEQKETFTTELPLGKMGSFLNRLQTIHLKYIQKLQNEA